jgi:hypothetical protein
MHTTDSFYTNGHKFFCRCTCQMESLFPPHVRAAGQYMVIYCFHAILRKYPQTYAGKSAYLLCSVPTILDKDIVCNTHGMLAYWSLFSKHAL